MKKEASIVEQTRDDDIADIVRSFERDLEESDRALEETLRFAETLLLPKNPETKSTFALPHLGTNETATTDDGEDESSFDSEDLRSDMSSLTHDAASSLATMPTLVLPRSDDDVDDHERCSEHASRCYTDVDEEVEEVPLATMPTSLAVDISKFCDCHIKVLPDANGDAVAAQVPVSSLIETVQALLGERQQVIGEALEIIQSSRRTVNMALTMAMDEDNYSRSCVETPFTRGGG